MQIDFKALVMEAMGVFGLCYIGGLSCCAATDPINVAGPGGALAHTLALAIMIYIGAATSGAHFNPAVTLALLVTKKFDCIGTLFYIIAQVLGGFVAGLMVWAVNVGVTGFEYGGTYPHVPRLLAGKDSFMPVVTACMCEFIATFFLVFMVFATAVDERSPRSVYGICIGGTVGMSAFGIGGISGAALNPTRWVGPWIVSLWGCATSAEKEGHSSFGFIPYIFMTCLGGIVGGLTYSKCFLPRVEEKTF